MFIVKIKWKKRHTKEKHYRSNENNKTALHFFAVQPLIELGKSEKKLSALVMEFSRRGVSWV